MNLHDFVTTRCDGKRVNSVWWDGIEGTDKVLYLDGTVYMSKELRLVLDQADAADEDRMANGQKPVWKESVLARVRVIQLS